jgi:hypothetical protein
MDDTTLTIRLSLARAMVDGYLRSQRVDSHQHPASALKWLVAWTGDRTSRVGPRDPRHWAYEYLRAADVLVDAGSLRGRSGIDPRYAPGGERAPQ